MKNLALWVHIVLGAAIACAQSGPIVTVDNTTIAHEQKGWRVLSASTSPVHFNLVKDDLIVRIDGKNASETGPMQMASLLNEDHRRKINLFVERGSDRIETSLRQILSRDYDPVGGVPFHHVATGFSAPDIELTDIDSRQVTLEQFKGKWLLIDFVATWCAPCMETFPRVLSIADQHQLSLLMIALNDREVAVRHLQHQYNIKSPIAMLHGMAPLPIGFGVTTNLWTGQIPSMALIRPDGEVALIGVGSDLSQIEKLINSLTSNQTDERSK